MSCNRLNQLLTMKVKYTTAKASSYGGLVPILKTIKSHKIPQLIRKVLPKRVAQAKYKYDDIFLAWILAVFCGGQKIEQITKIKKHFAIFPDLKIPSHDTIGRAMKNIGKMFISTTPDRVTEKVKAEDIHENLLLNELLIMLAKQIGFLKEGIPYTLHIDCTLISTLRGDSKYSYKQFYAYAPMACAINNSCIFLSQRNGNVHSAFQIARCLDQCLGLLQKHNIRVKMVVSDSAGYNKDLMDVISKYETKVLTVPKKKFTTMLNIDDIKEWNKLEITTTNYYWDCEVGETPFYMKDSEVPLKLIALRFKPRVKRKKEQNADRNYIDSKLAYLKATGKLKPFKKDIQSMGRMYNGWEYKLYLTNDFTSSPEELVKGYLQRGTFEQTFSALKNKLGYGWSYPPFAKLSENSVFLIVNSMASVLMKGIQMIFNKEIPSIRTNTTLNDFRLSFITVACWMSRGCYTFSDETKVPYHLLL